MVSREKVFVKRGSGGRMVHSPNLLKKHCPRCGHNKAWPSRGITPTYKSKCTRCGYLEVVR